MAQRFKPVKPVKPDFSGEHHRAAPGLLIRRRVRNPIISAISFHIYLGRPQPPIQLHPAARFPDIHLWVVQKKTMHIRGI